jgi:glycosyltransferase involved in cell wall biosynthesis
MTAPLLLDLSHTSHTRARTGIQRVARALLAALGPDVTAITYDPHAAMWRKLERWERANLATSEAATKRGAHWPVAARLRGRVTRVLGRHSVLSAPLSTLESSGLVVPEIFSASVARALPPLFARTHGPRVALFHDAIALRFPEFSPANTVARFPAYLQELRAFDGIAAVSEDSRAALVDYWRWLGARDVPPVHAIPLGIDLPSGAFGSDSSDRQLSTPKPLPIVLCVGSIEARKNHLALLDACEQLWSRDEIFSLHVIGLAQRETGAAAVARMHALQASGRSLRYAGAVSDAAVDAAYAACTFTVYPSLVEGFGLPVLESLAHGKPCICSTRGALGEAARGGGCVGLDPVDAPALAETIGRLLHSPAELAALAAAARARRFKRWSDYAAELRGWMTTLKRRD